MVGVALAVLLPLAVPGMTGGLLDTLARARATAPATAAGRAAAGRIDLFAALSGQLNQSEVADLVKVTTTEPDPFYLRFGVADELRPDGFRARNAERPAGQPGPAGPDRAASRAAQQRRYQATVEVTRTSTCRCCRSTPSR